MQAWDPSPPSPHRGVCPMPFAQDRIAHNVTYGKCALIHYLNNMNVIERIL